MIERKTSLVLGLIIGTAIGSLTPGLWGADFVSLSSLIWGGIGAVIGLYVSHRLSQ
jgi:uncharacterized membrane protein YeaQ/YmgE (transglycosylase-associated protein family)